MKQLTLFSLVALFASPLLGGEFSVKDTEGTHADILRDGKVLVRYMYARDESTDQTKHNTYKVYAHVFDGDGKSPITKGAGGKFTHHRGLFIGFSKLTSNGKTSDLWHMKNALQTHVKFLKLDADKNGATISSLISWSVGGKQIVEETRTMTVHADSAAHLLIDFTSSLKAICSDAKFDGDPEHAGMQYRPHNDVAQNKSAKYVFPAEDTNVKSARDLPWAALNYKLGDASYSVQHMNHPSNPKGTRYSAYRDYGRFGAFPVFSVAEGKSRTLRYRIRVNQGAIPARSVLSSQYKNFVGK